MYSIRSLLLIGILSLFLGTTFAVFTADSFIAQFQAQQATLSTTEKKVYYKKVFNNLSLLAIQNRTDIEQFTLYTSLKDYVNTQIQLLSGTISSPIASSISGMNILKVDLAKVRDTWLALHNTERKTKSLTPFTYSAALEGTASTWAQHLADIGTTTHKRKNTDGYYSYTNIKDWFLHQGINFSTEEKSGQPLFTENIGWNIYSCKKTDCTDDFIKAIKKSRTFFMSEKGSSYTPHYNAIVGNFSTIGLGVAVVGNKYYLVTHYTQDLK
ncbi:MAG: CAP domain-containing protein [candidate division SR1 bacterium]|nr:CAP domain-containing protein [candidate division SR1 bacterium]